MEETKSCQETCGSNDSMEMDGNSTLTSVTDPFFHDIQDDVSLPPDTLKKLTTISQLVKSGKAFLDEDEEGRPIIQYEQKSKVFWDASKANMITDCGTDDVRRKTDSALDFINHLKTNCPPSGVRYNKRQVHTNRGMYREGYEFEKTEKVLGSGNVAGDIVVIKDNKTGMESAQKTILLPFFRNEEVKAMVDLAETGFPPALYLFKVIGNKVEIYMEIISAFTVRAVLDKYLIRMDPSLAKQYSLYFLDAVLCSIKKIHDKGWVHGDLHAGNMMLQKHSESKLGLRIIDYGKAQYFDGSQELQFEEFRKDIIEIVRTFSALYCGQEFLDALDLQQNWQTRINEVHLAYEDKEELSSLLENAVEMKHLQDVPIFHGLVQEKRQSALPDAQSHDDMMRRVLAVLFPDTKDFRAILHELKEDYLPESNPPGVADSVVRNHPHSPNVKHLASSGKTVAINPIDELLSLSSSIEPE